MSENFNTIDNVAIKIKSQLDSSSEKKKIVILYAFNGVGKTRLSRIMQERNGMGEDSGVIRALSYNALFEDLFVWDNIEYILKFDPNNEIITYILDQGLGNKISDNFQKLTQSKIFPSDDFGSGHITFSFSPGDDRNEENIKISRGEESLFIWSVFYTVFEDAILVLNTPQENRETEIFNGLEYIVIDDPVSSIDDTKIITMALELIGVINSSAGPNLKILVTTHHALFFNVMCNEYSRHKEFKSFTQLLSKNITGYKLENQGDTPFAYHIAVKEEIKKAIDDEVLKKYHFNLFRGLLEKTATFLGYNNWSDCVEGEEKKEILRLVNLYSHGKLSDLESTYFPDEHKDIFKKAFSTFIGTYKWK